jgi:hypothetical protein
MKLKITAIAIMMAFGINSANAQAVTTAKHQHQRIHQGVKSGELTKSETTNLRHDQKEIHQEVREAKSDGVFSKNERKNVAIDQRQLSREIFRKKHNNRDRN